MLLVLLLLLSLLMFAYFFPVNFQTTCVALFEVFLIHRIFLDCGCSYAWNTVGAWLLFLTPLHPFLSFKWYIKPFTFKVMIDVLRLKFAVFFVLCFYFLLILLLLPFLYLPVGYLNNF